MIGVVGDGCTPTASRQGRRLARSRQPGHVLLALQLEQGRLHAGGDRLALASGGWSARRMGWPYRPLRGAVGARRQTRRRLSRSLVARAWPTGRGHLTISADSCLVLRRTPRAGAARSARLLTTSSSAAGFLGASQSGWGDPAHPTAERLLGMRRRGGGSECEKDAAADGRPAARRRVAGRRVDRAVPLIG